MTGQRCLGIILLAAAGALAPASTVLSQATKLPGLVQEGAYDAGNLGMEMQPAPRNDDASAVYAVAAWPTYTPHSPMATERRLSRASAVRALAERKDCLIFDHACSIGLKSGE